ncbi:tRNA (5-methylaminomethyl-2-thiouridine)(34)-methyltransferase MnmD [Arcticibacter sp. MXS-1]|uniref:tRNA (5-methylaminomethyl-2-thiouridine)(34)-methyltransferase MnmD n=1 Tax=Arcticibacter sp. MXS-1 TaxID=3341726 RepID=UPI0035A958B8
MSNSSEVLSLVATADGSNTLFNAQVGEHYHSRHGALQESKHVFLNSGLKFLLEKERRNHADILEVGFGTGLNFLLTADYCTFSSIKLSYTGIEAYPLFEDLIFNTGYDRFVSEETWNQFVYAYATAQKEECQFSQLCSLRISVEKLEHFQTGQSFDLIYFDAFAAIHQPEMWSNDMIEKCAAYLRPGGVFVTYAITGNLKRCLKAAGFSVEKAPGAPGKREMLRAVREF